jgi:hypothetical protein
LIGSFSCPYSSLEVSARDSNVAKNLKLRAHHYALFLVVMVACGDHELTDAVDNNLVCTSQNGLGIYQKSVKIMGGGGAGGTVDLQDMIDLFLQQHPFKSDCIDKIKQFLLDPATNEMVDFYAAVDWAAAATKQQLVT